MKKVIDGKLYDTETAELIYEFDNGCYLYDFMGRTETLYKTGEGEFFLQGECGPSIRYGQSVWTDEWVDGENIRLLTAEEATQWREKCSEAEETLKLILQESPSLESLSMSNRTPSEKPWSDPIASFTDDEIELMCLYIGWPSPRVLPAYDMSPPWWAACDDNHLS